MLLGLVGGNAFIGLYALSGASVVSVSGLNFGVARIGDVIAFNIGEETATASRWGTSPLANDLANSASGLVSLLVPEALDEQFIYGAVEIDGEWVHVSVSARYYAPVAAGGLGDLAFAQGSGVQFFDAASDFAVVGDDNLSGVQFSLAEPIAGVSINSETGQVSIDLDVMSVPESTSVVVQADNSGGSAQTTFSISVVPAANFGFITFGLNQVAFEAVGAGSIEITSPAIYAGTYAIDMADLVGGAINLVAPVVIDDGSPAQGEPVNSQRGLWIYNPENGTPLLSNQWFRDGVAISGAEAAQYTLTSADAGGQVSLRETVTQDVGARSSNSAAINVAAAAAEWTAPQIVSVADGSVTLSVGSNQSPAPSAPTINAIGDGAVTLSAG
ncbi:MAG: hypothetical protein AAF862_06710 [Pseudomonadota bacterium]